MTATKKRLKCTLTRYCTTLSDRITGSAGDGKTGFADGVVYAKKADGTLSDTMLSYPVWYRAPKGTTCNARELVLNFCPWCGFDLRKRIKKFQRDLAIAAKKGKTR